MKHHRCHHLIERSNRPTVKPLLTIDERNYARQSIAKAEAELQRIKTEIAELLERQKTVMGNLSHLKKTVVIHGILPGEIIGDIFSILAAKRICIPHKWDTTPPQITVSHVCSKWREIALATPALWDDVRIVGLENDYWVQVAMELLFYRAGKRGVSLALDMKEVWSDELRNTFCDVVLPLHVKKLYLTLLLSDLEHLLRNTDDIIANIDEIALIITSDDNVNDDPSPSQATLVSNAPQFFSKVKSLTCSVDSFIQRQDLPWAQMRYLNTCSINLLVSTVSNILRQSPLLEACEISVDLGGEAEVKPDDVVEPLALPQLRIFHVIISHGRDTSWRSLDAFLQSFKCLNLTDLSLEIPHWTLGMYNIIQNHYNLHRLLKLNLTGYPYPINKILHDAPTLQELVITHKFILMDESVIHAISSGKLGRCLTSLDRRGNINVKGVLDMIAARQRYVKQIVEAGRGWQDHISVIKRIVVLKDGEKKYEQKFKKEVGELKKLGIEFDVYDPDSDTDLDSDSE